MTSKLRIDEIVDSTDTGSPDFPLGVTTTALSYTGTLTGSTGVINIGSGQVYKDASGNVGIGTSSPDQAIHAKGADASLLLQDTEGSFSSVNAKITTTGTEGDGVVRTDIRWVFGSEGNAFTFSYGNNLNEAMRITPAGNVGIGTSAPSQKLVVSDATGATIRIDSTKNGTWTAGESFGALEFFSADNSGSGAGPRAALDAVASDSFGTDTDLIFKVNSGGDFVERARISGSNLLVGRTTNIGNIPRVSIQALEESGGRAISMETTRTTFAAQVAFYNPNGQVGSISTNGTTTSYSTSSDYRLKEDAQPVANPIDRLMALKPINFAWKVDGTRVDGFLAHEAQSVVPEAVTGEKDAVDKDGNPKYQGIDQSKLVPLLTAALQDAVKRIEQLEAQLNTGV